MAATGDLGIDFKTSAGSESAPSDIRELHTKVGMACEVELDTIGGRTKNPAARNVCSRSVSEKREIRSS
jgi:hypothetical protein